MLIDTICMRTLSHLPQQIVNYRKYLLNLIKPLLFVQQIDNNIITMVQLNFRQNNIYEDSPYI